MLYAAALGSEHIVCGDSIDLSRSCMYRTMSGTGAREERVTDANPLSPRVFGLGAFNRSGLGSVEEIPALGLRLSGL